MVKVGRSGIAAAPVWAFMLFGMLYSCATLEGQGTSDTGGDSGGEQNDGSEPTTDGNGVGTLQSEALRSLGRVGPANVMSWPSSGFEVSFNGTDASFDFQSKNGNSVIALLVDGNQTQVRNINSQVSMTAGPLSDANHLVRVVRLSEPRLGEASLTGFRISGTPIKAQQAGRRIEIIGDSISLGYGVSGQAPCANSVSLENSEKSFGALAAKVLGADLSIVAWAGKGLLRNDVSDTSTAPVTMTSLWTRAIASDSTSVYDFNKSMQPQAVIVALGTNDFEYASVDSQGQVTTLRPALDENVFVASYVQFVGSILSRYPGAHMVLVNSPMLIDGSPQSSDQQHTALGNDLNAIVAQINLPNVTAIDLPPLDASQMSGCGNHPNAAGHQALAGILSTYLKKTLGW